MEYLKNFKKVFPNISDDTREDQFYSGSGWSWIKLWFEKCGGMLNTEDNSHKHLLHSEYLEQVLNKTLKEYEEEVKNEN